MTVSRLLVVIAATGLVAGAARAWAQEAGSQTAVVKPAPTQFSTPPGAPDCVTIAVQDGDPSKGPSIMLAKFAPGCTVPWHWHTPTEQVMMVSGAGRFTMKDGKPILLRAGAYALAPSHHVHQFSSPGGCTMFLRSDAPFDMHYVDAAGKEIPPEAAMKAAKGPVAATKP